MRELVTNISRIGCAPRPNRSSRALSSTTQPAAARTDSQPAAGIEALHVPTGDHPEGPLDAVQTANGAHSGGLARRGSSAARDGQAQAHPQRAPWREP